MTNQSLHPQSHPKPSHTVNNTNNPLLDTERSALYLNTTCPNLDIYVQFLRFLVSTLAAMPQSGALDAPWHLTPAVRAAEARGRALDLKATVEALLDELGRRRPASSG